jgi:hypothetical protein
MRKSLLLAMAVLTPLASVTPAMALDTGRRYDVRFDGLRVGTWRLRNKVVETAHTCRYTVMWSNLPGPPLSRTRLCRIDEYKAGDDFDCEVSRRGFFDTLVTKAPGTCRGFDDFGQETNILTLVAGEDSRGELNGIVISAAISDVQNLEVR